MLLVQDGKACLDDDIRRFLPEMPDYGVPITLRHLLNHTSGLREQWSMLALTGNGPGAQVHNMPLILELASRQKGLNFKPGDEFFYTNTNYTLAAIIVERISGVSLQRFTDERLFQPLGMSHTRWREDFRTVVPGRATAYAPTETGFIANMPFTNVYGNGGMLTTYRRSAALERLPRPAFHSGRRLDPGGGAAISRTSERRQGAGLWPGVGDHPGSRSSSGVAQRFDRRLQDLAGALS